MQKQAKIDFSSPQIKQQELFEAYSYSSLQNYQYRQQFNNSLYNFGTSTPSYLNYPYHFNQYFPNFHNSYPLTVSQWSPPSTASPPSFEVSPIKHQRNPNSTDEHHSRSTPQIKQEHQEPNQSQQDSARLPNEKKKVKSQKQSRRSISTYYWSADENSRYHEFIKANYHIFDLSLNEKKSLRVNVMMSKKVKTRNAQQCHSHHQKMMKKYGSLFGIIENMNCEKGKDRQGAQVKFEDQVRQKDQIQDDL